MVLMPKLQQRIAEFLPMVRVGIDFGEWAGGIAIVRNNEILRASTYLDFHAADLAQRRTLRRGRRTRHAKKMRLARLRAWVLRQRLPSGETLPDPYAVMHDRAFMVQPGVFHQQGQDPEEAPSWVDLAKEGKVSAAGFVRALTLIFQKRGYRWDDRGPAEMPDKELEDFLSTSRIPDEELAAEVRKEIARRRENPNDPVRGRKNRVGPERLQLLLEQARQRPPAPRVAEHRRVREADLREVIDGFGRSSGVDDTMIRRWQRELAGERGPDGKYAHFGLLNKALRLTRFDNRLKTTCAWCEKKTPRKARVRELAYRAAVNNLRVREGFRTRVLNEEECRLFLDWWADRGNAPGVDTLARHIARFNPEQKKMARQLHDLLKNDQPEGRTSLCLEHLEMAAGDPQMSMKKAGVDWQTLRVRKAPNPCREAHDRRVLRYLEQVLFRRGKTGQAAWRHGPVSLLTLEIPDSRDEQRAKPGEQKQRREVSFRERLLGETKGQCTYCGRPTTVSDLRKDHIFPRARGGPDLWNNLAAACATCNDTKGDRSPQEWLASDPARWSEFARRVDGLGLPPRKHDLLLSADAEYPDNPTPLAHVGARPRQFIRDLREMFRKYRVTPPEIYLESGKPHVQRVGGDWTYQVRKSWLEKRDGTPNFPPKDRSDLRNHAQDAALLAACPPHTWRESIFIEHGIRPDRSGQMIEQSRLAVPEIAPDWPAFEDARREPIVHILGNYSTRWRRSFADQTLWGEPDRLDTPRLKRREAIDKIRVSQAGNIVSRLYRERFVALARALGLEGKATLPINRLHSEFPGVRRLTLRIQGGGALIRIKPRDGPARKIQIKPASEGAVFWRKVGTRKALEISIVRPAACGRLGMTRVNPSVPVGAEILGELRRHQLIRLEADLAEGHPSGWYRVKEFSTSGVIVLHENSLPVEIARRVGVDSDAPVERTLRKGDLLQFFARSQPAK